jgi:anti-sigma factor RsiW
MPTPREVTVRCSWCESLLDEYVEATLPPRRMLAVAAHLRECPECESLHRRLRIVDGLLHTRKMLDVEPQFSKGVMAQVRTMPVPHAPRRAIWIIALFYLICAWVSVLTVAFVWPHAHVASGAVANAGSSAWQAITHGVHALSPVAPIAVSLVVGVLLIDALLLAAIYIFYRTIRPRLNDHLAASEIAS